MFDWVNLVLTLIIFNLLLFIQVEYSDVGLKIGNLLCWRKMIVREKFFSEKCKDLFFNYIDNKVVTHTISGEDIDFKKIKKSDVLCWLIYNNMMG